MQFNPKIGFILGILVTIETAISGGLLNLGNAVPAAYIPTVVAWSSILAFVGSTILTFLHGFSNGQTGPLVPDAPLDRTIKAVDTAVKDLGAQKSAAIQASAGVGKASLILLAIGLSALAIAWAGPAGAATKGAPLTGNIVKDVTNAVKGQQASTGPDETSACDFNLFANLNATSVVLQIQQCLATPGAALANAFLPDVTDALASANAYGDQVGVSCLKPGLAIVQAGVGTPAAPEVPAVPATATAPEIPAVPAIAAKLPGPILIFQKFREFELAGGPAACKSWVTSTVAGAIAP